MTHSDHILNKVTAPLAALISERLSETKRQLLIELSNLEERCAEMCKHCKETSDGE